ncbi:MAG: hypothetical protein ACYCZW_02380 [Minisyncoccota bacterium]
MTKQNLEKVLREELCDLNDIIDRKIIRGLSYSKEARRHKVIIDNILNLRRRNNRFSWFARSFGFASFIL